MHEGLVFNIQRFSIHDGPGIRTTVFLKGCPLSCWWCHNPESQSAKSEVLKVKNRCIQFGECRDVCPEGLDAQRCIRCGACVAVCPTAARQMVGKSMRVDEVVTAVMEDAIFYEESAGGVTFSGGEPLTQHEFLMEALEGCRARGLHTAVDTCGYTSGERLMAVAGLTDLFLYDIKTMDDAQHREYTGVSNEVILKNLEELNSREAAIWIRLPVIPGFNDDEKHMDALARFLANLSSVQQVNLLPYHETGTHKAERLGREVQHIRAAAPSRQDLDRLAGILASQGLKTRIGG